jgi:MFS family permease
VPLAIFLVTRVVDGALLVWLGRDQIPPVPMTPHQLVPTSVAPSSYLHLIANWDGQWYRTIAEHGYPSGLPAFDGTVVPNQWAFYPLYPSIVRLVMLPGLSYGLAASLVSIACGAAAMCLLYRMLVPTAGRFAASMTLLALCTFPTAILFQAAYTESLALLLVVGALWSLRARRYGVLVALALLLALTRPVVLPLALVVGVSWIARWRARDREPFPRTEAVRLGATGIVVALSFLIWPAVAAIATGRADAYFVTANAWYDPNDRSWPSWLVVFVGGGSPGLTVFIGLAAAGLALVVVRRSARLWGLELRSWAWAYPLYLLGSTRPTTSIFRYAMLAAVPWWPFPEVGSTVQGWRPRVALACLVLLVGCCVQVIWLRWYFVIDPASRGFP